MAVDEIEQLAVMASARRFALCADFQPNCPRLLLVEQHGLEDRIAVTSPEALYYTIQELESQSYRHYLFERGPDVLQKLLRKESVDEQLVRQVYWALCEEPMPPSFLADRERQQLFLEAVRECTADQPDKIYIADMWLLNRLWKGSSRVIRAPRYYFTPYLSDKTLADPASAEFMERLARIAERGHIN